MTTLQDLELWVVVWLVAALFLLVRHWWKGRTVGLLFAYVLSLGAIHWLAPALILLPWHRTRGIDLTAAGMRQSGFAILALALGAEVANWLLSLRERAAIAPVHSESVPPVPDEPAPAPRLDSRVVWLYLVIGIVLYAGVSRVAAAVPSATALVSAGSTLMVVAVGLKCWNGWVLGRRRTIWLWLLASLAFPLVTVLVQGFLGYGFAAMLTVLVFVASFYRPRRTVIALALVLTYVGLSVYVTYMRDRREIRAVVWSGAAWSDRVSRLVDTLASAEWFDPQDARHLDRIDERLNQNYLVGAAVATLEAGVVPFAHGGTVKDAALALVPRALWPDKPVIGGSGDLVSTYTGMTFADGVSVGIGQVMECYVNFGTPGVVMGFMLIGTLLVLMDRRASDHLIAGDAGGFLIWYLPALSLLQVGGSLVEVTSTAGASLIVAIILKRVTLLAGAPVVREHLVPDMAMDGSDL